MQDHPSGLLSGVCARAGEPEWVRYGHGLGMRIQRDKDEKGHLLTIAGLAHTAFSQWTSCRSHVVIATSKPRASTLTGLTFMGLGLVDLGILKKKQPEVQRLGS